MTKNYLLNKIKHFACFLIICFVSFAWNISYGQSAKTLTHTPSLHYQYENGVANRLSIQNVLCIENKAFTYSAGWRFHLNEQVGLGSFSFALNEWRTPKKWLSFGAEYQYHEYPDYNMGENMLALLSFFRTGERLRFGGGFTYRSPIFTDNSIHSPFTWGGAIDELYFIAQIKWDIIKKEKYLLSCKSGTYDFMRIQTKDHAFLKLENTYLLKENIRIKLDMSTAAKGFSGLLFAINEFRFNAGLSFYY